MKAVNFISKRFNSVRNMPRSVRIMRTVAGVGVMVAVIALVLAQSIGSGFEGVYRKSLLDFNAHVVIMGAGEIEDPADAMGKLRALEYGEDEGERGLAKRWGWLAPALGAIDPNILSAYAPAWLMERYEKFMSSIERGLETQNVFLYREGLIIGGGGIKGVVVKGLDPEKEESIGGMTIEYFETDMSLGEMFEMEKGGKVFALMGKALAQSMGFSGSAAKVKMLIPREEKRDGEERFQDIEIVGTFESGLHDYDSQFMLMDIADVRRLFGVRGKTVTGIELRIEDPKRARWVAAAAERTLGPRYRAITWQELNSDLLAAVRLEKLVTSLIMGIMLAVAALNIIAALVLTTLHRMREISVLKSLGLSDRKIGKLFIRGGLSVGMRGVVAGLAVGVAAALIIKKFKLISLESEIYLVDALPIDISWLICGIITLFCAAAIYITSRVAAARLAKVPPAEGLARAR
jgi:lipoprotein-releasing system permease protein